MRHCSHDTGVSTALPNQFEVKCSEAKQRTSNCRRVSEFAVRTQAKRFNFVGWIGFQFHGKGTLFGIKCHIPCERRNIYVVPTPKASERSNCYRGLNHKSMHFFRSCRPLDLALNSDALLNEGR